MAKTSQAIGYRLFELGFALALACLSLAEFSRTHSTGSALVAVGWSLLGASWFMQPVVLSVDVRKMLAQVREHAVGPVAARAFTTFGGLACLFVGLFLKFASSA